MNVLMPQPGETVAEAKITTWFKAVGDTIKPGDNLFEIETDKASMEVPSTVGGVLTDIRVQAGETAPVGVVVAVAGMVARETAVGIALGSNSAAASRQPVTRRRARSEKRRARSVMRDA